MGIPEQKKNIFFSDKKVYSGFRTELSDFGKKIYEISRTSLKSDKQFQNIEKKIVFYLNLTKK